MADVVNLNRFRKMRQKEEREKTAEANRIRFGRTKAEKLRDRQDAERREADLDGKKVDGEKAGE
ncbi:DUF4169 family protein [Azospirillum brasilense]|uniref:DUF4169 family protein n=1 Tax=Azospirillum brasilense TaxID=192 RepID=A0A0P0F2Z7_AZOBR|nr:MULTISPECIES: DUF4169 family protein [Azospirillum]ALJ34861.1 hypothetical protein AMK58_05190 [Azospirillum brasilense]MDW7557430.1 DUF4169 family protein [Azospirillum brasilense]MDW7596868.1 DUF4169 family protein [Azospirillum brasilense]MDW7631925.1 DUF4169 family protein [Azospirillum brasilense]MDX5953532.1 DUF4169 family protein [Azospirillum brasilense]